jgi:hypothetical protein
MKSLFVYYVVPPSGRLTNSEAVDKADNSTRTGTRSFVTSTVGDGTCDLIPRPPKQRRFLNA